LGVVISKGQIYFAPAFNQTIVVRRVASDGSWADIAVHQRGADGTLASGPTWHKRQPLTNGAFAFDVEEVQAAGGQVS